jgi:hypothetical protein
MRSNIDCHHSGMIVGVQKIAGRWQKRIEAIIRRLSGLSVEEHNSKNVLIQ